MKNDVDEQNGPEKSPREPDQYLYQSAGITERPGHVPLWLFLVIIGLLVWGGYYLITYWDPI